MLLDEVEQVGTRLRRHGLQARGVSLKGRFGDFETISRSMTLKQATNITGELWQAVVELISNTRTATGLIVKAALDTNAYPLGTKVSDEELNRVRLTRHRYHGDWNYTICPDSH